MKVFEYPRGEFATWLISMGALVVKTVGFVKGFSVVVGGEFTVHIAESLEISMSICSAGFPCCS